MYRITWEWLGENVEEFIHDEEEAKELVKELKGNGIENVMLWMQVVE